MTSLIVQRRSVENVRGISREINLPATLQKRLPARLRSFEVEQNPALRGPHERRRAGLSVFLEGIACRCELIDNGASRLRRRTAAERGPVFHFPWRSP